MVAKLNSSMFEWLNCTLVVTVVNVQVPKMKMHIRLLGASVVLSNDSAAWTFQDYVERSIQEPNSNEVIYTWYCIVILSGHEQDNSLMRAQVKGALSRGAQKTHLDKKEKRNMFWMEYECNVTHLTSHICVLHSNKGHTFCDVANGRWLNFDRLDLN